MNKEINPDSLNSFLDYNITILNKSPGTIREYNHDLIMFFRYIKKQFRLTAEEDFNKITVNDIDISTIKKITLDDIHSYISYTLTDLKNKPTTRARKVASIRAFFKYLSQKTKLIDVNPAQNLETPKIGKRIPKYLSFDESKALLNITADNEKNRNRVRDYAIITLFLNCGMRLSELVNINIKDISFSENKLNVIGKGNKERTIYLNKACINSLNKYLEIRPKEGIRINSTNALFLSERRERISNRAVQLIVRNELRRARIRH